MELLFLAEPENEWKVVFNNNVHLSRAHQRPERSHDTC